VCVWFWGLNSGLYTCRAGTHKAGDVPLQTHCHTSSPFFSDYFGGGGLSNYFAGVALNLNPPDLSVPNN
jgi:hypothetical protein